jgi:hypothetical protein
LIAKFILGVGLILLCGAALADVRYEAMLPVVMTTKGPGQQVVATEHSYVRTPAVSKLTLKCKSSSSGSCHYYVVQSASTTRTSSNLTIAPTFRTFELKIGESRIVEPATKESAYCHSAQKSPDPLACSRIKPLEQK